MSNKAAWITEAKAKPFKVDDATLPKAQADEVVVRNYAVAINPVDAGIQEMGIIYTRYPNILGCDIAGEVVEVGSDVTRFKKGDRVIGVVNGFLTQRPENGAFQLYCALNANLVAKIPDHVSYTEGCVLGIGICTAAASLFEDENLKLPYPQINPTSNGQTLLIWGGSSSVGSCGIQLAKAAGLEVIAISSEHNFDYCRELGAEQVFDHHSPTIVEDIVKAFKGRKFAGVFNTVMYPETIIKSTQIAQQLDGNKFVATILPPNMPAPEGLPSDIKIGYNWSIGLIENEVGKAVWGKWITAALTNGSLKCKPDPFVVGQGLEKIQEACERQLKGVSASKTVVELP